MLQSDAKLIVEREYSMWRATQLDNLAPNGRADDWAFCSYIYEKYPSIHNMRSQIGWRKKVEIWVKPMEDAIVMRGN